VLSLTQQDEDDLFGRRGASPSLSIGHRLKVISSAPQLRPQPRPATAKETKNEAVKAKAAAQPTNHTLPPPRYCRCSYSVGRPRLGRPHALIHTPPPTGIVPRQSPSPLSIHTIPHRYCRCSLKARPTSGAAASEWPTPSFTRWPLHDIAITNIVWCMPYKGSVGGGAYIAQWVRNSIAIG